MPHTAHEKKRVLTRLRRIRGQTEALERALEGGADCGAVLQQIAAIRGAVNGLMSEVMEAHLREEFGQPRGRDRGMLADGAQNPPPGTRLGRADGD